MKRLKFSLWREIQDVATQKIQHYRETLYSSRFVSFRFVLLALSTRQLGFLQRFTFHDAWAEVWLPSLATASLPLPAPPHAASKYAACTAELRNFADYHQDKWRHLSGNSDVKTCSSRRHITYDTRFDPNKQTTLDARQRIVKRSSKPKQWITCRLQLYNYIYIWLQHGHGRCQNSSYDWEQRQNRTTNELNIKL